MLNSLTADSIYSQIMMDESSPPAFILIEGRDENSIFSGHIDESVSLIVCGGKTNVLGAASIASSNGKSNVFGLVDRDFDGLRPSSRVVPQNVVVTRSYDLLAEILAVIDKGLRRAASAGDAIATSQVEVSASSDFDDLVHELTLPLAGLRLAAMTHGYPLKFAKYNFRHVVDHDLQPLPLKSYLENSTCTDPDFAFDDDVTAHVESAAVLIAGDRTRVGGHDLVGAVVALLHTKGSQISRAVVESAIISQANCCALSSVHSIRELTTLVRSSTGVEPIDCVYTTAA